MALSFKLQDFAAGGILPEGDYQIREARFSVFDYGGRGPATIALRAFMVPWDLKSNKPTGASEQEQYYSCGPVEQFAVVHEGKSLEAVGTRSQLSNQSNFYLFVQNIVNAGFPEDKWGEDISVLDGVVCHITHIPLPKRDMPRSNLTGQQPQEQQRDRTLPVVSVIHSLPWEKKGAAKAKSAATPATKKAEAKPEPEPEPASGTNGDDVADVMPEVLDAILGGNEMVITALRIQCFKVLTQKLKDNAKARNLLDATFKDRSVLDSLLAVSGNGYTVDGEKAIPVG